MNTLRPVNPYIFSKNEAMQKQPSFQKEVGSTGGSAKSNHTQELKVSKEAEFKANPDKLENTEISKYIAIMVRMENGIETGELSNADIRDLMEAFSSKLSELNTKTRDRIEQSSMFKQTGLSSLDNFGENATKIVTEGLESDREKLFSFLKSNDFISALKDEPVVASTFSPAQIRRQAS